MDKRAWMKIFVDVVGTTTISEFMHEDCLLVLYEWLKFMVRSVAT